MYFLVFFKPFVKKHFKWMWGGIIVSMFLVGIDMFLAYTIQTSMIQAFGNQKEDLVSTLFFIFIGVFIGALLKYAEGYQFGKFGARTLEQVREAISSKLETMSMTALDRNHSGDLLSKVSNDTSVVERFISRDVSNFISQPLLFLAAFTYLLFINWELLLFCVVVIPVSIICSMFIAKPLARIGRQIQHQLSQYNAKLQEVSDGRITIKARRMESYMEQQERQITQDLLDVELQRERRKSWIIPLDTFLRVIPFVVCIMFGGYLTVQGHMRADELLTFIYLINFIVQPAITMPRLIAAYKQAVVSTERLHGILNEPDERNGTISPQWSTSCPLELRGVEFAYQCGSEPILHDFSYSFKPGQMYAVIGESGSGKSTLMKLISGLYEIQSGEGLIYGCDMNEISLGEIRGKLSFVEQHPYLFPGTLKDNIRIGKPDASQEEIEEAARKADAHIFINSFSEGYETLVADGGISISGGQRQRVALARAILKDAPIMILDEAGSALDYASEQKMHETLIRLRDSGVTVIIVTHRLGICQKVDNILLMRDGRLLASGSHEQMLAESTDYVELNRTQATA